MRNKMIAAVSTEVAIGMAVAIVALFVVLGIFGDNLSSIVANSNIGNVFKNNDSETEYASYDRDYSDSQVNVQIMGEQGLEMLRRKANNKAIEIIEESFSNSNPNGNSIAYLSTAIRIITGNPSICTYMKKDSDKHCDDFGQYNYDIGISSAQITVKRLAMTDESGNKRGAATVQVKVDSLVSSVLAAVNIVLDKDGYNSASISQKYKDIQTITEKLISKIRPDAILLRLAATFNSTSNGPLTQNPDIMSGELEKIYETPNSDMITRDDADNPVGYSTNGLFGSVNKDPDDGIDYITKGAGKTIVLNSFNDLLNKVNSSALTNLTNVYSSSIDSSVIQAASSYAKTATYNQFVYNVVDKDSLDGAASLSGKPSFYNNGSHDISKGAGRVSGKSRICFTYDFEKGPGNGKWGDSRDWAILITAYVDPSEVVSTYLAYFKKYCTQH